MAKSTKAKLGNRARGRQIASNKAKYARQFAKTERNRLTRRLRHLEKHPNDLQAKKLYG